MVSHAAYTVYAGYTIREKPNSRDGRWFILKDGANVMPGAAQLETEADAFMAVDVLEAVDGDGQKFWHLWRAIRGTEGRQSHHHSAQTQASPQQPVEAVVLGYSRSNGQYYVHEIHGSLPTVSYQHSTGGTTGPVQVETITVHVGDWLLEAEANNLGIRTHLIVRPYTIDGLRAR